ncbi:MAG: hypothetical protein ACOY4O_16720 [Pseudomonadota bacterium]
MSEQNFAGGVVFNAAVLVVVAVATGAAIDYAAVIMGFAPPAGCALLTTVQTYAAAATICMVFAGVLALAFASNKAVGTTFIIGGLVVGSLPGVVDSYLGRYAGIGCGSQKQMSDKPHRGLAAPGPPRGPITDGKTGIGHYLADGAYQRTVVGRPEY